MPSYKLYYFNTPARGELPRVLFAAADTPFDDIRVPREEWPVYKPKMPFGQMPVLEVDGEMLAQEYAISKYLANIFGMSGEGHMEQAKADMYAFASEDIYANAERIYKARDDATKRAELMKQFVEETAPRILTQIDSDLSSSTSGYLVGEKLTWADIAVFVNVEVMEFVMPSESVALLANYARVKKNMELVRTNKSVAAYLEKRPSPR